MATRFGRRSADGTYEYHDSEESLIASQQREASAARAKVCGFIGLWLGGILTYVLVHAYAMDMPKWLRFGLVLAGSGGLAYLLAKLADLICMILALSAMAFALWMIGGLLWKAV